MAICTSFSTKNHQSTIISDLKTANNLPFSELVTKEGIACYMQADNYRERVFTPEVTLWAFLSQVMGEDKSQQVALSRVIASTIAEGKRAPSANTSAYSQARSRLSEQTLASLTRATVKEVVSSTPMSWLWRGKRIKLVDGSTLSMPDTIQNQLEYPQPTSQKPGVGFPMARILVVVDYITGVLLDFALGKYSGKNTGEHALLRQLMPSFLGRLYTCRWFVELTLRAIKTTMNMNVLRGKIPGNGT